MSLLSAERSPGAKLGLAILVGIVLAVPLFAVWMLVYDRQMQSQTAQASIAEGWGGPQTLAGPLLVIPYRATVSETVTEANRPVVRSRQVWRELTLSPEIVDVAAEMLPERRQRSICKAASSLAKCPVRAGASRPGPQYTRALGLM